MYFLKEYKSVICILLIAILVFSFSTVVTSATIGDMNSFKELEENTSTKEDEYEDIKTMDDDTDKNKPSDVKNTSDEEDESKNDIKSNVKENENIKEEKQNTSTDSLSKAGIEDTPGIVIIAVFVVASIYAYIRTKKYNNT